MLNSFPLIEQKQSLKPQSQPAGSMSPGYTQLEKCSCPTNVRGLNVTL